MFRKDLDYYKLNSLDSVTVPISSAGDLYHRQPVDLRTMPIQSSGDASVFVPKIERPHRFNDSAFANKRRGHSNGGPRAERQSPFTSVDGNGNGCRRPNYRECQAPEVLQAKSVMAEAGPAVKSEVFRRLGAAWAQVADLEAEGCTTAHAIVLEELDMRRRDARTAVDAGPVGDQALVTELVISRFTVFRFRGKRCLGSSRGSLHDNVRQGKCSRRNHTRRGMLSMVEKAVTSTRHTGPEPIFIAPRQRIHTDAIQSSTTQPKQYFPDPLFASGYLHTHDICCGEPPAEPPLSIPLSSTPTFGVE